MASLHRLPTTSNIHLKRASNFQVETDKKRQKTESPDEPLLEKSSPIHHIIQETTALFTLIEDKVKTAALEAKDQKSKLDESRVFLKQALKVFPYNRFLLEKLGDVLFRQAFFLQGEEKKNKLDESRVTLEKVLVQRQFSLP